ncbi:MAG: hypothetical protein H0X33_13340 [Taibaiella sp.]|nr:hypothetical protein [Taibaiella sp.]
MDGERELDYLIAEKFLKLPKVYVEEWGKEVYKGHDGFCDNVLLRTLPYFSSNYDANRILIRYMQVHGSSFYLAWDEGNNQWTCSWVTSGYRFVAKAETLELAVSRVAYNVITRNEVIK